MCAYDVSSWERTDGQNPVTASQGLEVRQMGEISQGCRKGAAAKLRETTVAEESQANGSSCVKCGWEVAGVQYIRSLHWSH